MNKELIKSWIKVAIKNFPHYEIGKTKVEKFFTFKGRFIVFKKTGHCLHFTSPDGIAKKITR